MTEDDPYCDDFILFYFDLFYLILSYLTLVLLLLFFLMDLCICLFIHYN